MFPGFTTGYDDNGYVLMRLLIRSVFFLVLFPAILMGCAAQPAKERVPFHIWQHTLILPTDSMAAMAVTDNTLLIRYQDGARLAVSLVDFTSEPLPEGTELQPYMDQLYGNAEPEYPGLKQARDIVFKGVQEQSVLTDKEGLTIYWLVEESRSQAFVVDDSSDELYLMFDSEGRTLDSVLATLKRR